MKLEWSRLAMEDRGRIFDYIEQHDPRAAATTDNRIREQIETLSIFPESGRPGRVEGTRELAITRTPYVAAYRIETDAVRVLRILHGAQLWPGAMPEG